MTKASLELIIKTLNDAGVRYMVVGGIAVNAHGYVRLTVDVDLLIELESPNILVALRALGGLGYRPINPIRWEEFADPKMRQSWMEEKQMKVLKLFSDEHRETVVDVFVYDPLGFDEAYARVVYQPLAENVDVPVCGYADLVKLKLAASRRKDLEDLEKLKIARGEA
jgi:hypothetical protein